MSRNATVDRSLREALRPRLHRLMTEMWQEDGATRDFADPEGVHRMRVASRKLRAALDASGPPATKGDRRLRTGVRRLARALGAVRDGDVLIGDLQHRKEDGEEHPGIDRLVARLDRQRETDRARLLALLDTLDANGFRESSLTMFARERGKPALKIRRRSARDLASQPLQLFIAMTASIPPEEDIETLHRLRIVTKRLRYVLQLLERPLKPGATEILSPLGTMQDQLGDIHNDDVLIALVRNELHAIVDERIARVTAGEPVASPETNAVLDDLLALLARTTRSRHERYLAFVQWWTDLQDTGFPAQVQALGTSKR